MIEFTRAGYDRIVDAATDGAPAEVCGILAGERSETASTVEAVHPTENVADSPRTRYAIDPEEQLAVIEGIENAGLEVVGFYHSHPTGPPQPSETDTVRATWPGYSYVICTLGDPPYVGSWRWHDEEDGFDQEILRLVD